MEALAEEHTVAQNLEKPPKLIPLVDWPKHHAWPPLGGLRHMAFFAKTNGFARAFKKCGRRILIDEKAFFEILEEKNRAANN